MAATLVELAKHELRRRLPRLIGRPSSESDRQRELELCAIYNSLVEVYFFEDAERMPLIVLRACRLGERSGEPRELAPAYASLGVVFAVLQRRADADHFARRAIQIAERWGSREDVSNAYGFKAICHYYAGDLQGCIDLAGRAIASFRESGRTYGFEVAYFHGIYAHLYRGEFDEAVAWSAELLRLTQRTRGAHLTRFGWGMFGWVKALRGQLDAGLELIERGLALADANGQAWPRSQLRICRGHCLLRMARYEEAVSTLEEAAKIRDDHRLPFDYVALAIPLLARALVGAAREELDSVRFESRRRQARKRVREALRLGRAKHPNYLAPAHTAAGELAALEGRLKDAVLHFEQALQVAERQGAGLWAAEARQSRATSLGGELP